MNAAVLPSVLVGSAVLSLAFPLSAQQRTGTLALRVVAHGTAEPIPGAQVHVSTQRLGGATDPKGKVRITGIRAGSHVIEIERIGYDSERVMIEFSPGQTVEGEVELTPRPVVLERVEAVAQAGSAALQAAGFYERRKFGAGTFLVREDIEARAKHALQPSSLLQRMPGVRLEAAPGGSGYMVKSRRSLGRGCYAQVLLDGQPITGEYIHKFRAGAPSTEPPRFAGVNIDRLISLPDIEAVEWYSGPAGTPPQFNTTGSSSSSAECGTLVIWTRKGP